MNNKDYLKNKAKTLPELPGIYQFLDSHNNIIYIGKSKCLKKRVQSYFVNSPKWEKVEKMIHFIQDIHFIVTDTHLEARLLECELIKEYDQRYIYIKVNQANPHRCLSVVAEREKDCFGPFRNKYSTSDFLTALTNLYPIHKTMDGYFFEYHVLPLKMNLQEFEENRSVLIELFSEPKKLNRLIEIINHKREEASQEYRFELASYYRDTGRSFHQIKQLTERFQNLRSRDILLKLPLLEGYKLFYIAKGLLINSHVVDDLCEDNLQKFMNNSRSLVTPIHPNGLSEKAFFQN